MSKDFIQRAFESALEGAVAPIKAAVEIIEKGDASDDALKSVLNPLEDVLLNPLEDVITDTDSSADKK